MADALQPKLSLIVLVNGASERAEDMLFTLSSHYQQEIVEDDYEVIVAEAATSDPFGERRAKAVARNVRYVSAGRTESPLALGVALAQASFAGLLLDGSALVTPRIVEHGLLARRLSEHAVAIVPGYDIEGVEAAGATNRDPALAKVDWKRDGYRLFTIASFGPETPNGYLCPLASASAGCIFLPTKILEAIDLEAADVYTTLSSREQSEPVILVGEGVFRRARPKAPRQPVPVDMRQPMILGAISGPARRFLAQAARRAILHRADRSKNDKRVWRTES